MPPEKLRFFIQSFIGQHSFWRSSAGRNLSPILTLTPTTSNKLAERSKSLERTSHGYFSKDIETFDDLFVHQLRDIYYAEKQLVKALPKMAEKATSPQLKQAFQNHLAETKGHVSRVEQVFKMHGVEAKAVDCPAIDGIIEEANEVTGEVDDKSVA